MDNIAYTNEVFEMLKDSPAETVTPAIVNELVRLFLFIRNADTTIYGNFTGPLTDIPKAALTMILNGVSGEDDASKAAAAAASISGATPLLPTMTPLTLGDLSLIFGKINIDPLVIKDKIKILINNSVGDPIIDGAASVADENELITLVNQIRDVIAAGLPLPPVPPLPPSPPLPPLPPGPVTPTPAAKQKMYTFYAYEKDKNGIQILAQDTDDALMNTILTSKMDEFITIPNTNPRIEAIAETLLGRENLLNQPINFKIPEDIKSLTDSYVGTKDKVLGQGWSVAFRSPVFLASDIMSATNGTGDTKFKIYYFDRKTIPDSGDVGLFNRADVDIFKTTPNKIVNVSDIARLDTFIENINKIAKIELKDGDDIYLFTIEQSPFLKSGMAALTPDQCQYLSITITQAKFISASAAAASTAAGTPIDPTPTWGNSKNGCMSALPSGPLYKPQFDILIGGFLSNRTPSGSSGPVVGGSKNKYTRKFMEPVMYHTRHRRHRITRANIKRKRYNKTRRG